MGITQLSQLDLNATYTYRDYRIAVSGAARTLTWEDNLDVPSTNLRHPYFGKLTWNFVAISSSEALPAIFSPF